MAISTVSIKGTAEGLVIKPGPGNWQAFLDVLKQRLVETAPVFQGGKIIVEVWR
jgi:hypothetical protein